MKKYNSDYYQNPIEVEEENGEIIVSIITKSNKKVIYSMYDIVGKTSYSPYIKNAILASFINKIPLNILVLGFGAGSYAKYFCDYLGKKVRITGVEIDNVILEIAKHKLGLKDINYFNMDYIEAINILSNKKNNKFDVIFFDIYDNNSMIPGNFNEYKVIELINSILDKKGIFIINFANYEKNSVFYKSIDLKLLNSFGGKKIEILNNKGDNGNVIGVYNLKEQIDGEALLLNYLKKVKEGSINYDSNLVGKKYFL